ncbi:MAG: tetratricopeptide repeat protein [Myxococcota bacterium]|nr:tetratricopeptide repeat protein [Myxococcota bacterium]
MRSWRELGTDSGRFVLAVTRGDAPLLSPRQLEVLELMAKGLVNREIAGVLGIAPATVKRHVSMVIEALGVSNRTEAVSELHQLGLGSQAAAARPEDRVPGFGERPAVAVLPFDTFSATPGPDHFADGLVEDLTTALAAHRWFPVIARNSSFVYRGRAVDVKHVSRELGARYVVEGSVRRAGERVRVQIQLIDGVSGAHVFAERYDRRIQEVFDLQDEIVERIVLALHPAIFRIEGIRARRRPARDLNAWECLQRGTLLGWSRTREDLAEARRLFERAAELDPDFSPAHTCIAGTRIAELGFGFAESPSESLAAALRCAERAVQLDDGDPTAWFALAGAHWLQGRLAEAEAATERSIELDPSFARAYWGLSITRRTPERADEAVALLEKAIRLSPQDPLLPEFRTFLASAHFVAGRDAEALAEAARALALHREAALAQGLVAAAAAFLGRREEAERGLAALLQIEPHHQPEALRRLHPAPLVDRYAEGLRRAGLGS